MTERKVKDAGVTMFDARVGPDGSLVVPAGELRGKRVRVRITEESLARSLVAHGIEETEVDRIAAVQLEERGRAARFLLCEGRLARGGLRRRAVRCRGRNG